LRTAELIRKGQLEVGYNEFHLLFFKKKNKKKPTRIEYYIMFLFSYVIISPSSRNQEEELSKSKDLTSKDSWSNDPEVT